MVAGTPAAVRPFGRELERLVTVWPFGFQLWDPVMSSRVADGFTLVARRADGRMRPVTAGPSGTFALRDGATAWALTSDLGDEPSWASAPEQPGWTIQVHDGLGRYLPFRFDADGAVRITRGSRIVCGLDGGAATDQLGLAGSPPDSPPDSAMPLLPLFSAPARPVPAGFAAVSLQLASVAGPPIPRALVQVTLPRSRPAFGLTDEQGMVVLPIPYPELEGSHASPPVRSPRPLRGQSWPLTVEVFSDPEVAAEPGAADRPSDLCAVIDQLASGPIPIVGSSPAGTSVTATLEFGRPLVVRSPGRSELVVDGGSPPSP